jgi:hypothetical protein
MTSSFTVVRSILVYGICLPLAVFVGYLLAEPFTFTTFTTVGLLLLVLAIPILLNWHHQLLVLSWNATAVVFFIRGRPNLWLVMVALSLVASLLQGALSRRMKFVHVPSVTWPLVFLFVVIALTARLTGGIGLRSLGGEVWGGRRYVFLFGAILGYFALASRRIPLERAPLYVALFFLGGLTWVIASMENVVGPSFYFIFAVFPVEQMPGIVSGFIPRLAGVPLAAIAALSFMLARYGIRGIFFAGKLWRALLFFLLFVAMLFGGYRSYLITVLLFMGIQFCLEGLHRTRLLLVVLMGGLLVGIACIPLLPHLPVGVQRCFAWLPVEIDPAVRLDAEGSTEWRVNMWKTALPEIPGYLLLGKGFAIDPTDLQLTLAGWQRQVGGGSYVSGDYHNGVLSLIIPLGIWGVIGFLWFLAASLHVLYRNYRYGDPSLRMVNTFLLALFVTRSVTYLFVFGSFFSDMPIFCGLIGFSVSLNGGVSKPAPAPAGEQAQPKFLATILPQARPAFGR